jgi:hypothetical protein
MRVGVHINNQCIHVKVGQYRMTSGVVMRFPPSVLKCLLPQNESETILHDCKDQCYLRSGASWLGFNKE